VRRLDDHRVATASAPLDKAVGRRIIVRRTASHMQRHASNGSGRIHSLRSGILESRDRAVCARDDGDADLDGQLPGLGLVAERLSHITPPSSAWNRHRGQVSPRPPGAYVELVDGRAHESDAVVGARLGKALPLAEETVARVDSVHTVADGDLHLR
jgi:hypothetical protein